MLRKEGHFERIIGLFFTRCNGEGSREKKVKEHLYDSLGAKGTDLQSEPHNKANVSTTKELSPFCIALRIAVDKGIRYKTKRTTSDQRRHGLS